VGGRCRAGKLSAECLPCAHAATSVDRSSIYSISSFARASKRRWDGYAERLRSLEIDYKLVFGDLLNGQVGRFDAIKDLIDIDRGALI